MVHCALTVFNGSAFADNGEPLRRCRQQTPHQILLVRLRTQCANIASNRQATQAGQYATQTHALRSWAALQTKQAHSRVRAINEKAKRDFSSIPAECIAQSKTAGSNR
ncbi:hypothetical protein BconGalA64_12250 [Burkholderia contaminans]|nr:hypothetical protein BconGalA64_12250 [Burkholderia contaminans]